MRAKGLSGGDDLGPHRLAMMGDGAEFGRERSGRGIAHHLPHGAQRAGGGQCLLEPGHAPIVDPLHHGAEQIVHRAEIIIEKLGLQARLLCHLPRGNAMFADLCQDRFGRVDEAGAVLRSFGAKSASGSHIVLSVLLRLRFWAIL